MALNLLPAKPGGNVHKILPVEATVKPSGSRSKALKIFPNIGC